VSTKVDKHYDDLPALDSIITKAPIDIIILTLDS